MKKKHILVLIIIIAPFIAMAQFKVDFSLSPGISKVFINSAIGQTSILQDEHKLGTSMKGGFESSYTFKSNFGLGIGIFYSYNKSNWYYENRLQIKRYSKAISIPINANYKIKSLKLGFIIGAAININLNEDYASIGNHKLENNNLFFSFQGGCFYSLSDVIKLSLLYESDIDPFYSDTYLDHPSENYYFRSLNLKISYTLFGKQ